jgi:hypothetical protein
MIEEVEIANEIRLLSSFKFLIHFQIDLLSSFVHITPDTLLNKKF